ncbi:MAG: ECF transporter S component [Clostridiales bacterium]|nr:ECF transporter S component [Clostridiales bacterium]
MKNFTTKKLVLSAVFAALTCVATMCIQIPTTLTQGYIHPGDSLVILCAIFLDPVCAFFAAAIGSAMADMLTGYFIYVPITFIIKGMIALCGCKLWHSRLGSHIPPQIRVILCGVIDILFVAGGYCVSEGFIFGWAASIAGIPGSVVQGSVGLILAFVLYPLLNVPLKRINAIAENQG